MFRQTIRWRPVLVAIAAFSLTFGLPPALQAKPGLELLAQEGGASYALAIAGHTVYLVVGPRVVALDVSNPEHPTVIGRSAPLPRIPSALVVAAGRIFAATMAGGLWVLEPDGAEIRTVGQIAGQAIDLATDSKQVYVAAGDEGLRVFDARSVGLPQELAHARTAHRAFQVIPAGGYAFVATADSTDRWLEVVDIADPALPRVATFALPTQMDDMVLQDGLLYGADVYGSLHVIDVRDPLRPTLARSINLREGRNGSPSADTLAVSGGAVYVGGWLADVNGAVEGFLWTVDPTAPTGKEVVSRLATPYDVLGLAVAGSTLYAADLSGGLRVVDVTVAAGAREIGIYDPPGEVLGIAVNRSTLYTAEPEHGLGIFDLTDPTRPEHRSSLPGVEEGLWITGGRLFASGWDAASGSRVDFYDLSRPATPKKLGRLDQAQAADVAADADHVFVAGRWEGADLSVWDISQPASPRRGQSSGFHPFAVRRFGNTLVAIDFETDTDSGRLLVLDPSSASPMTLLGSLRLPVYPVSLEVADGHAYVGSFENGITVVDLAQPKAPRLVATLPQLGGIGELRADGALLFAKTGGGLAMIDIRRPCRPQVLAQADIPLDQQNRPGYMELRSPQLGGLDARDGLVVAAGKDAGFYVLRPTHVEALPPAGEACQAPQMIYLPLVGR